MRDERHAYIHLPDEETNMEGYKFTIENYAESKIVWHWNDRSKQSFYRSLGFCNEKIEKLTKCNCWDCLIIHMIKICYLRKWRAELNAVH